MVSIKKLFPEILFAPVLLILFLATRLTNILALPIFTDEAIYTRWSQIARYDSNWRFISLTDGKQPAFVWLDMIVMRFFSDPLLGGRVVSVICGFFVVLGLYFLTFEIFKNEKYKRIMGIVASALAVIYPFLIVYDKLALYESMIAAFMIWALYFQILLIRRIRFDLALVTGFVMGGAVLTKSSGFLALYLIPFIFLLFNFSNKNNKQRLIRAVGYFLVVFIVVNVFYSVLRLSPFYHIINQKNSIFVYDVGSWIKLPTNVKIDNLVSNSRGLTDWFFNYFTIVWALLVGVSFFIKRSFTKEKLVLFLWFFLPFIALALTGKTLYPRYIFFMTLSLIPLAAYTLVFLYNKLSQKTFYTVCFLAVIYWLISSFMILTQFQNAPIPSSDTGQYLTSWTSGVGVKETIEFLKRESEHKKIFIGTQGTFGLMPYAFELYLVDNPNIEIKSYWPVDDTFLKDIEKHAAQKDSYVFFYQGCPSCSAIGLAPTDWPLEKVFQTQKLEKNNFVTLYKVIPQ